MAFATFLSQVVHIEGMPDFMDIKFKIKFALIACRRKSFIVRLGPDLASDNNRDIKWTCPRGK